MWLAKWRYNHLLSAFCPLTAVTFNISKQKKKRKQAQMQNKQITTSFFSERTSRSVGRAPVFPQKHIWPEVLPVLWEAQTCECRQSWRLSVRNQWHESLTTVASPPQVNYSSPVVAVRFAGVQYDTHFQVQCKLNGKGIVNNSPTDRYLGSVTFSLDVGA